MDVRTRLARVRSRLDLPVLGRIAQTAFAAGASWELALQLPGHRQPFFAPIAAVIALGAERGRRGRQAIEMMLGVALGILLGAALVAVAGTGAWQLVVRDGGRAPRGDGRGGLAGHPDPGGGLGDPRRRAARTSRRSGSSTRSAQSVVDSIDERRLEDALALAREVARKAPRRRPARAELEALGASWQELDAAVSDGHAIAAGALRILAERVEPAEALAAAVRSAGDAVRLVEPEPARTAARAAEDAAAAAMRDDPSLGAAVVGHGVAAVAGHVLRAAAAREAGLEIAASTRTRTRRSRVRNVLR